MKEIKNDSKEHELEETELKEPNKIIVFYPVITGNGSKHMAANLSHTYKTLHPEKNVALVDLDVHHAHPIETQVTDRVHGLDNLLDKIDGEQLTSELFQENMIQLKSGIHFLKGTQLKKDHTIICRHHVETILAHLRELYDMVFISVSNRHDNAGTVYGLNNADEVVLVTKNNYANLSKIEEAFEMVTRYYHRENTIKIVINQYNPKSTSNFGKWITEHPVEAIGIIPFDENGMDCMDLTTINTTQGGIRRGFRGKSIFEQTLKELIKE